MRTYLQHGRRHAPGGSDPIIGLSSSVPMILANGSGASLTGGGNYLDLTAYLTTDDTIYSLEAGTGGLSSTHGIAIHQDGVYRAWFNFEFTAGTSGDTLEGSYDGGAGPNMGWLMLNDQLSDETRVIYDPATSPAPTRAVAFGRLFVVGGTLEPLPVAALPRLVFGQTANQTSGVNTYNVSVWILVERLGTSYTTNDSVPF